MWLETAGFSADHHVFYNRQGHRREIEAPSQIDWADTLCYAHTDFLPAMPSMDKT